MGEFKLVCTKCNSENITERITEEKLDCSDIRSIYGEGIKRQCLDCNSEAFIIFKTYLK